MDLVRRASHSLKGAAGTFCAYRLCDAASDLNELLSDSLEHDPAANVHLVEAEWQALLDELRPERGDGLFTYADE